MANTPCEFVWYELMTSDGPAAEAFYQAVVGWTVKDAEMPGMRYALASAGGTQVGGIMTLPSEAKAAGAQPGWSGYIAVPDVDAHAARLTQMGGTVHVPGTDIPGVGRFAMVSDPQGAVFALFKGLPAERPAPPPAGTPGTFGWNELHALDDAAAFALYADLFGWTAAEAMDMGPMGIYQLFSAGSTPIGGMMRRADGGTRASWLYYIHVEQIDAAADRVRAHGGQVLNGPMEVPGNMWIVQCVDPQGAQFALLGPR
ncbi:VOC family protein [Rhodoferax sp. WC2427]|uniref:VOC family protein n=1 Tax=Rhodoferax sp. WC2427 TaxID=3234144 RepID=UPI003466196D